MSTITTPGPAVAAPHVRPRSGASFTVAARGTARRTILQFFRSPQVLLLATIQSALVLFLFRYIFGGAIDTIGPVPYVEFLVPGYLSTTFLWNGMSSTAGIAEDSSSGVYDRLRSAGRPLELPGEPVTSLADRVAELREVAEITLRNTEETLPGRAQVEDALQLLEPVPAAEDLLDLSDLRVGGEERERFASFGEALGAVERAALDAIAARDRTLLVELLGAFDAAYAEAKA